MVFIDVEVDLQYCIYNFMNLDVEFQVIFGGNIDEEDVSFIFVVGELFEFSIICYGDYCVIVIDLLGIVMLLSNKLIMFNQGESKVIFIYNINNKLGVVIFVESGLFQVYDKIVNFINLVSDFDDVDFYLVRNDEIIDIVEYDIQNFEFVESISEVLLLDYYEVIVVYEDDNEEQVLFDRIVLFGFIEEENYIVIVELVDMLMGYEINVFY